MKKSYLTWTDQFCGAGGNSQAIRRVSQKIGGGIEVRLAMNHWPVAIETHNTNFPETQHVCTDVSACDPRRYPSTDGYVGSPECTTHTPAGGNRHKRHSGQYCMFDEKAIDPATERSRATMWDVCRFAEYHDYNFVVIENVVEAKTRWSLFDVWLQAMHRLGYNHHICYFNSMFFPPTPQSRDRMYVVFWKKGNPAPDLDYRPKSWCQCCDTEIDAIQSFKDNRKPYGKYKFQYVYRCPRCSREVVPYYYSAFNMIDWTIPGKPVLDRKVPLRPTTIERINWGLENYGKSSFMIYLEHSKSKNNATSIFSNMKTQTTSDSSGIVTPFIVENNGQSKAREIIRAIGTLKTNTTHGIVSSKALNGWLTYYNGTNQASRILSDPVGTLPTHDRVAIAIHPDKEKLTLQDVLYRTIRPHEVKKGMAFDEDYVICGNSGEKVKQLGNAVTPPVMEWIIERVIRTLM